MHPNKLDGVGPIDNTNFFCKKKKKKKLYAAFGPKTKNYEKALQDIV